MVASLPGATQAVSLSRTSEVEDFVRREKPSPDEIIASENMAHS